MDPNKRSNWYIVAGVWAFFAAYIGWTYWREDLPAQRAKEAAPPPPARVEDEVVRTLPDERYGSPALRGALCQLNESAQNASQMPPRHACAALRCGACDGAAF